MKVLVNAIPIVKVTTGIGRYVQSLYSYIEQQAQAGDEFTYFDGKTALRTMPEGGGGVGNSRLAQLFWKLPPKVAAQVRSVFHAREERQFAKCSQGVDVYHEAAFFPFKPSRDCRVVFTLHDLSVLLHPEWHPRERVMYYEKYFHERMEYVDAFLTVSEFSRKQIVEHLGVAPNRVTVTPLAYSKSLFHPRTSLGIDEVRSRFGLPERYYLFVGTGDPRKNFQVIPKALDEGGKDIPVAVVGWSGWENHVAGSNAIPLGYVSNSDLAALYSGARALIYPSLYEGFGLPVVEAMACGCPVVTTKRASLPEVGGKAAIYLDDPEDASELAGKLALLDDEEYVEHKRRDCTEQAAQFSWQKTAAKTLGVLRGDDDSLSS